jgi:hypothetical protein
MSKKCVNDAGWSLQSGKFRGHSSRSNGLTRQASQPHEVQARDRVPLNGFESEEKDHSGKPRNAEKVPSTMVGDDQPRAAGLQNEACRDKHEAEQMSKGSSR